MVDPTRRGRGLGAAALDWALATARSAGAGPMTVETESLTDSAAALFASRGLRQVFAEDVMRLDLAAEPPPAVLELAVPAGVTLHTWRPELVGRFFGVYRAAFRDRPGFPGWSQAQWAEWIFGDEEFRPEWSVLAVAAGDEAAPGSAGATSGSAEAAPGGDDVGFIGCADGWIVQVGVRPDRRGRGLGAALVGEALRRMRDGGLREAFLDVNVDNPAARLYVRLGFEVLGRRARFSVAG